MSRELRVIKGKNPKSRTQKRLLTALWIILAILVAVLLVYLGARLSQDLTPQAEQTNVVYRSASNSHDFSISADTVVDIKAFGKGVVILTDKQTIYLDKSGGIVKNELSYSSPAMSISDDRVLVYDRGGTDYRIENKSGIRLEGNTEGDIITGALGKKDNFAFSIRADNALSSLVVYKASGRKMFIWNCGEAHIVAIALSDNGKRAAVGILSSLNAQILSTVKTFDFDYNDELYSQTINSEAIHNLSFNSTKMLSVCTDKTLRNINSDTNNIVCDFSSDGLRKFVLEKGFGHKVLMLAKYGNDSLDEVNAFGKNGKLLFNQIMSEEISWLDASARYVATTTGGRVDVFNYSGKKVGSVSCETSIRKAVLSGSRLYILTSGGVDIFPATDFINVEKEIIKQPLQTQAQAQETLPLFPEADG